METENFSDIIICQDSRKYTILKSLTIVISMLIHIGIIYIVVIDSNGIKKDDMPKIKYIDLLSKDYQPQPPRRLVNSHRIRLEKPILIPYSFLTINNKTYYLYERYYYHRK